MASDGQSPFKPANTAYRMGGLFGLAPDTPTDNDTQLGPSWEPAYCEADAPSLTIDQISDLIAEYRALIQRMDSLDRLVNVQERYIAALSAQIEVATAPRPKAKRGRKSVTSVPIYARAAKAIRMVIMERGWKDEKELVTLASQRVGSRLAGQPDRTTAYNGVKRAWEREKREMEGERKQMHNRLAALLMEPPRRA